MIRIIELSKPVTCTFYLKYPESYTFNKMRIESNRQEEIVTLISGKQSVKSMAIDEFMDSNDYTRKELLNEILFSESMIIKEL